MLKQISKRKSEGFTIIEVLIVLAIAGLIMVVVFLAVPALQRSGRNNALNTDANNTLTAVGNYISNNGGSLPTAASFTSPTVTIGASGSNQETATLDANASAVTLITSATGALTKTSAVGSIQVVTGSSAVCNATDSGLSGTTAGPARGYVVLFVAESGSGNILKCIGG